MRVPKTVSSDEIVLEELLGTLSNELSNNRCWMFHNFQVATTDVRKVKSGKGAEKRLFVKLAGGPEVMISAQILTTKEETEF